MLQKQADKKTRNTAAGNPKAWRDFSFGED
jgi:hypothetical protein